MPCTARETALLLVAEREIPAMVAMRSVLRERFPSLTFLAASALLDEAVELRKEGREAGGRVARGEIDRETALTGLADRWPEVSREVLERFLGEGSGHARGRTP